MEMISEGPTIQWKIKASMKGNPSQCVDANGTIIDISYFTE